jgi:hypothetical protein
MRCLVWVASVLSGMGSCVWSENLDTWYLTPDTALVTRSHPPFIQLGTFAECTVRRFCQCKLQ